MFSHRFARAAAAARHAITTLGLASALALSALGPPSPEATAAQPKEPAARLQLVVKQVEILDDREGSLSGKGR